MTFTKLLTLLAIFLSLSTQTYAKNDTNTTQIDPKVLAKAQKEFVQKLGSKKTTFQVREIKEGFVFNETNDRITLLVFWDKKCKSCIADIPNLNRYFLDFRGKLEIIAVELSGMTSKQLQQFAKDKKVLYSLISGIENKEFVSSAMHKFQFGKDKNGKDKKEGLPFMVVMGYTGHTHAIIRGIPNDPAEMEKFLIKIMDYYENKKKNGNSKAAAAQKK
jgi:thiol-disulfide isomerase/thioredoxin